MANDDTSRDNPATVHTVAIEERFAMQGLPTEALDQVAAYFQALSEPTRLQLLNLLREGEKSVGELAHACGCSSANISRHLAQLGQHGLVTREARGNSAYFRIADDSIYELCDLVCGSIARRFEQMAAQRAAFGTPPPRR